MKKTVEIIFDSDLKIPYIARYFIINRRIIRNGKMTDIVFSYLTHQCSRLRMA
jgi:hypothetical protein